MMIRCPECEFARSIDESKIPATAQVATCPRCKARFRFRNVEGGEDVSQLFKHSDQNPNQPSQNNGAEEYGDLNTQKHGPQHGQQHGPQDFGPNNDPNFAPKAGSNPGQKGGQKGGQNPGQKSGQKAGQPRDIWDHIASLGEKWGDANKQSGASKGPYQGPNLGPNQGPNLGGQNEQSSGPSDFGEAERGGPVPWEDMVHYGIFGGYVQTLKRVLLQSRIFFSAMPGMGEVGRPVLFYLVTYLIQLFTTLMWINVLYTLPDALQEMMAEISLLQVLLAAIMQAVTGLCLVSILCSVALRLGGVKNVRVIKTLRIVCYSCAGLVLGIVPFFGPLMSFLWVAMCMYQGFVHGYGATRVQALGSMLPVCLLLLFFVSVSMSVF